MGNHPVSSPGGRIFTHKFMMDVIPAKAGIQNLVAQAARLLSSITVQSGKWMHSSVGARGHVPLRWR